MLQITCRDAQENVSAYLTQWDQNRKIRISGLNDDSSVTIYFCNKKSEQSTPVNPLFSNGIYEVSIPNYLLESPYPLIVDICINNNGAIKTLQTIEIPVRARIKPEN